jgi:hypothetical protein
MTGEETLRCLVNNPSDIEALGCLYANNRTVIDAAIEKSFGRNRVVREATRHVLSRIAARAHLFAPECHTPEVFVAELADAESRGLLEEIEKRIANWEHEPLVCTQRDNAS